MIIQGTTLVGGTYRPSLPTNGLQLFLDSGSTASYPGTGTTWHDLSGQNNNATTNSGMTYSASNGGVFDFDGTTNAFAQIGAGFGYDYSAGITVNVWAKFTTPAPGEHAWERLIDFGNGAPANNILITREDVSNNYLMDLEGVNSSMIPSNPSINYDTWAMYTLYADGTYWKLYKNGVFQSYEANALLPATITRNYNYIGRSNWPADPYFLGSMSIVQLYNRALSEPEITACFNTFKGRYGL